MSENIKLVSLDDVISLMANFIYDYYWENLKDCNKYITEIQNNKYQSLHELETDIRTNKDNLGRDFNNTLDGIFDQDHFKDKFIEIDSKPISLKDYLIVKNIYPLNRRLMDLYDDQTNLIIKAFQEKVK
ncbi:hypothetical protein [Chryseobacterium viscerum]|uniref:Uncharacterized protein n=1 Tax=Chryseobacterium viscerum TaxID=1037377 RepID=A0A5N4BP53_9FLAO|nr:hypothetical protein [Chryseobacterium viscerum]KAB1230193.1 hypothetical protein F8D52_13480 [Chryseobacterium viscerum]